MGLRLVEELELEVERKLVVVLGQVEEQKLVVELKLVEVFRRVIN